MQSYPCDMDGTKCFFTLLLLSGLPDWSASSRALDGFVTITSHNTTEVTVNPGENFLLTCEGDSALSWNYPNITDRVPNIELSKQNGKFVSSLQIANVTYMDVGYYNCSSENNPQQYSTVYLFVKDEENLLTYDSEFFIPLHVVEFHDITIPCKPTHPSVKVDLCYNSDYKLSIGESDVGVIRYDQKVGFILENAKLKNNGFYYCCLLSTDYCNEDECGRTYSLDVLKYMKSIPRPQIDETYQQQVTEGNSVTFICKIAVPSSVKLKLDWIVPNKTERILIDEYLRFHTEFRDGKPYTVTERKLTVLNVTLDDEGNYICQVTDYAGNKNSETKSLSISRLTNSIARPQIDETNPPHVTVGDNVTLVCTVTMSLPIKLHLDWIVPNKAEHISTDEEETECFEKRKGLQYTTSKKKLTIFNVKLEDEGNYICQVTDQAGNKNSEKKYLRIYRHSFLSLVYNLFYGVGLL